MADTALPVNTSPKLLESDTFWKDFVVFPSRVERALAMRWWIVLAVPLAMMISSRWWLATRVTDADKSSAVVGLAQDPLFAPLTIALLISGLCFTNWKSTTKEVFAHVVDRGIVGPDDSSKGHFASLTSVLHMHLHSHWRLSMAAIFVSFTVYVNRGEIVYLIQPRQEFDLFSFVVMLSLFVWSYAAGVSAWVLITFALWIRRISKEGCLRVQLGHPDGCGGLELVGECCFQSVFPLFIGMLLCLYWANLPLLAARVTPFGTYAQSYLERGYFNYLAPYLYVMMIFLFLIAMFLLALPIWPIHKQMLFQKEVYEAQYARLVGNEVRLVISSLNLQDADAVKTAADRARILRALEPATLKVSAWPFDRAGLVKYGLTPFLSLSASLGKGIADVVSRG